MCMMCFVATQPPCPFGSGRGDSITVFETTDAPEDYASTPYFLNAGDVFRGGLFPAGDYDLIGLNVVAGTTYTISMNGVGPAGVVDTYIELFNASGSFIDFNDDASPTTSFSALTFTATYSGTYYVLADSYSQLEAGNYELSFVQSASPSVPDPGTVDELARYLTHGYWEGTGRDWHAFDTSASNSITVDLSALTMEGRAMARIAFEVWEMVADIDFVEVTGGAQVVFDDEEEGGYATYVSSGNTTLSAFVNVSKDFLSGSDVTLDSFSFLVYVHEIGHVLGLGHQGPYNASGAFPDDAEFGNDSWSMSVMSYFDQDQNFTDPADFAYTVSAMIADIVAVQNLYGAPVGGATAGNTVYGLNSNLSNYLGALFAALTTPNPGGYSGGPMALTLFDEGGYDVIDLSFDPNAQVVNLNSEAVSSVGGLIGNMIIARGTLIEEFRAGTGSDSVTGNAGNNVIQGNAGNDTLDGGGGRDSLWGGSGNDLLRGGSNHDSLVGDAGADTMAGNDGNDTMYGGANNDRMFGNDGIDLLYGGDGNDSIQGLEDADTIHGDGGADSLAGGLGADLVYGGSGADLLLGGEGRDLLYGGADNDTLNGNTAYDTLHGDAGDDLLNGQEGWDVLYGGLGNDTLYGTLGIDLLDGGDNNDVLYGGRDPDSLLGGAGDDLLDGGTGSDSLFGDAGNDTIFGNVSNDVIDGGTGDDSLLGDGGSDVIAGGIGQDSLFGGRGFDTIFGGDGDDRLDGGTEADSLEGGGGNDQLFGGGGNDTLDGGAGNDLLAGGSGRDTFIFNGGLDTIEGFNGSVGEMILFSSALLGPAVTAPGLLAYLDTIDRVTADGLLLDFGTHELLLASVGDLAALEGNVGIL